MIHLVTGGARAGKSAFVLAAVERELPEGPVAFIATTEPADAEMELRIQRHQEERGSRFITVEEPISLGAAVAAARARYAGVVVDCLTVWLSNLMWCAPPETADPWIEDHIRDLLQALETPGPPVWLVTNEVGLGIVPENGLARRYRDRLGRLNQQVAAGATQLSLLVCGIPLKVKG